VKKNLFDIFRLALAERCGQEKIEDVCQASDIKKICFFGEKKIKSQNILKVGCLTWA